MLRRMHTQRDTVVPHLRRSLRGLEWCLLRSGLQIVSLIVIRRLSITLPARNEDYSCLVLPRPLCSRAVLGASGGTADTFLLKESQKAKATQRCFETVQTSRRNKKKLSEFFLLRRGLSTSIYTYQYSYYTMRDGSDGLCYKRTTS